MPVSDKFRLYGEVLCNFVNAKNTDEAGKVFKESVKKVLYDPSTSNSNSDHKKNLPDVPFPTLEEFNRDLENTKNLSNRQKILIKEFIEKHPSHLHYETKESSINYGLETSNVYNPVIYHSPDFDLIIDKFCKEKKLSDQESSSIRIVLGVYFYVLEPEHNHIGRVQQELRSFLNVQTGAKEFGGASASALEKYETLYNSMGFHQNFIVINDQGGILGIEEPPPFDWGVFVGRSNGNVHHNLQHYYDEVIAFCFFKFFREERNHKYLKKCLICDDFFIADSLAREVKCNDEGCARIYEKYRKRYQRDIEPGLYGSSSPAEIIDPRYEKLKLYWNSKKRRTVGKNKNVP